MRALLAVVLTLAALYAGFWVVTVRGLDAGIDRAVEVARDRGWQVEIGERETSGFPSRFDVTAREVDVTSPGGALHWQAPVVQTAALSYRPNRVIATLPPEQRLTLGGDTITVGSEAMRGSLHVAPSTALGLETVTVEAASLDLQSDRGWQVLAGPTLAAVRRDGPEANAYDIYLSAEALRPTVPAIPGFPETEGALTLEAEGVFDRPLDRLALADPARLRTLRLQSLVLDWGRLGLRAAGDLDIDAGGVPDGQIDLEIADWRAVLAFAEETGLLAPGMSTGLSRGLVLFSGGQDSLSLPLTFTDGRMALGPVPLGPAPRLR